MSRAKGTANLAASLEVLAGAPLDAREKVPTKADLYLAANFPYPYVGLETYVVSENKKYRLVGNDVTVEANWEEIGSGGGGGTTVVANPEGEATDDLEKLQVGNDIYSIPSGGSGADTEIIADDFDATESYAVGEYVVYEDTLYKCTTAHTGDWDASDFEDTQVMDEMPDPMPAADMSDIVTPLPGVMSRRHKYSTTEQVVGEWIDGKPIYQKTFTFTMPSVTLETQTSYDAADVSDLSIDNIIDINGAISNSNYGGVNLKVTLQTAWAGSQTSTVCYYIRSCIRNNKINIISNADLVSGKSGYVTIQYTKTTD